MKQVAIHNYAKTLIDLMGGRAEAFVAQKCAAMAAGEITDTRSTIDDWHRIHKAVQVLRH